MKQRSMLLLANAVKQNVSQAFLEKQKSDLITHLLQADDEEDDRDKLKVLNDGDGIKLLMDIYSSYISDDDYINFMPFCKKVDILIYQFRGNRGLTKEDRLAMEEEAAATPKKSRKKKKSVAPPSDSATVDNSSNSNDNTSDSEVTASDIDSDIEDFFTKYLTKTG